MREGYKEDALHVEDDGTVSRMSNKVYLEMLRQELVRT